MPANTNVTFSGVLCDKLGRTIMPCVIVGQAELTAIPPDSSGEGPPHIWGGGNEPFPTPPIAFPPGWVGGVPPDLGPPPDGAPPADASWEWGFSARYGQWLVVYVPGDKPQPPPGK